MASIAESLKKAAYLLPLSQELKRVADEKRKEEGLKNLLSIWQQSQQNINDIYGATKTVTGKANFQETPVDLYGGGEETIKSPEQGIDPKARGSALQQLGTTDPAMSFTTKMRTDKKKVERVEYPGGEVEYRPMPQFANILQRLIPGVNEPKGYKPSDSDLETSMTPKNKGGNKFTDRGTDQSTSKPYEEKTVSKYTPEEQNRLASEESSKFFMNSLTNADIDPQKTQAGYSVLQSLIQARQPKKKDLQGFSQDQDVYDEYGNLVKLGSAKKTQYDIEGSFDNPDTGSTWTFDKQKGVFFDTGISYDKNKGRTSVSVNTANPPDIGTEEQNIEDLRNDLTYFENIAKGTPDKNGKYKVVDSKTRETTTASKEWVNDQITAKKDRIKSQLKKNVTTVNSKIPHFKEHYDTASKHITKNTSDKKIDEYVDVYMKKESFEAKDWLKKYLKDYRRTLE